MSADLCTVAGWLSSNRQLRAVNGDKCLGMWLGNTSASPSYHLDSQEINSVETIKLLGVTMDSRVRATP